MNITSEIFSTHNCNSSVFLQFCNYILVEKGFDMFSVVYIFSFLISFPPNLYVMWLIVTGTGNGLAAEFFIFNLSVCEILLSLDVIFLFLISHYLYVLYYFNLNVNLAWKLVRFLYEIGLLGRPLFECLICVERYLAVVHPVIFLKLKPLRYKLMCCAAAWMSTMGMGVVTFWISGFIYKLYIILLIVSFLIVFYIQLFCLSAVLRVLKQSGPGERGRKREEENHMKKRAFHLILITTLSVIIVYVPIVISLLLVVHSPGNTETTLAFGFACFAVVGLVQPLLFLYRVGKLRFINNFYDCT